MTIQKNPNMRRMMNQKLMKYADIPSGCEWRYPNSGTEYMKLTNGDSMSCRGIIFRRQPNEMVILIDQSRREGK